MTLSRIRLFFVASTLLILVLALGFGSTLSSGSFKKSLTESYVSSFVINGGESVRKIEYALKYGKRLDNFFDIQSILQEVKTTNPDVQEVKIILADGRVAYSLLASAPTGVIADSLRIDLREMMRTGGKKTSWRVVDHQYNTLISIFDPVGQPIGVMDILFDEKVIAQHALASERKILEVQLKTSEDLFTLITQNVVDLMAIIDATGAAHTVPAATLADSGAVFRVTVSSAVLDHSRRLGSVSVHARCLRSVRSAQSLFTRCSLIAAAYPPCRKSLRITLPQRSLPTPALVRQLW